MVVFAYSLSKQKFSKPEYLQLVFYMMFSPCCFNKSRWALVRSSIYIWTTRQTNPTTSPAQPPIPPPFCNEEDIYLSFIPPNRCWEVMHPAQISVVKVVGSTASLRTRSFAHVGEGSGHKFCRCCSGMCEFLLHQTDLEKRLKKLLPRKSDFVWEKRYFRPEFTKPFSSRNNFLVKETAISIALSSKAVANRRVEKILS